MSVSHLYSRERLICQAKLSISVDSSSFVECVSEENGGAIYCSSSNELNIISCFFHYCNGNNGGCLYSIKSTKISCCSIVGCTSINQAPSRCKTIYCTSFK